VPGLPSPSGEALYPELAEEYAARVAALDAAWAVYERWLEGCASALGRKLANPLDVSIAPPALDDDAVDSVNRAIERVNEHVQAHNDKTRAFAAQVSRAMRKLELHFASEYLQDGVQEASIAAKEQLTTEISAQGIRVAHLEGEVAKLEAELSSPALGAAEFNAKLHRFLGRDDLSLVFDPAQKGYQIERTHGRPAKNLSEGEKTAIAFIYFITKLHEQGNRVEDTIVVLDDPISSFDSNHLFGAFSYIASIARGPSSSSC
jgi:wobble nucleotide-excising tRNase